MIVLFGRRIRMQEAQAEQLLIELEESRGAELRAAALAERQHLARDMHDVLAHSLSGLMLQLEGARLLARPTRPTSGWPGLSTAPTSWPERPGRGAAGIGMLRDDELPGPDRLATLTAPSRPTPAYPPVHLVGTPPGAGPAVRLALYRVTQEALTNVRKHARPARVEVRLAYLQDEVTLAIEDFAAHARAARPGAPDPGDCHPIVRLPDRRATA